MQEKATLGVIIGNRGFFPNHLVQSGRETILRVLEEEGVRPVALGPEDTTFGGVETPDDARKCATLFKAHRDDLDGILVSLPNFGEEKAVANAIRYSELKLPVLVHAFSDAAGRMTAADRRDSFCGKMSVCHNLAQHGIAFTLTTLHTVDPTTENFRQDLRRFLAVCRVVMGLRQLRVGAIGARPANFNTVRYSEKQLERAGIAVETLDLSEVLGRIERLADGNDAVRAARGDIESYAGVGDIPDEALTKMAKLAVVIERWMEDNDLQATALQCWTAMQDYFGVMPCTVMSMMSNRLKASACETDVPGAVAMYGLSLATGRPGALVDWNNNYGDDPDKAVVFHCSNLPKQFFADTPVMGRNDIIAGSVGLDRAYGALGGRMAVGPFTFCRVSTDEFSGTIKAYVGEGSLTADPLSSFGGFGVVEIPHLQSLLQYICSNQFEHHVALSHSLVADAMYEAMHKYLGWSVYRHR